MANIGNSIVSSPYIVDVFSGTGSQTAFTLQYAPATTAAIAVHVAGVYQAPSSYTLSGTTLTFNSAPAVGSSNIQVLHLSIGSVAQVPSDGSVTTAKIADGAITTDKIADGTVIAADIAANTVTPAKLAYNAAGTILTTDGASVLWRAQSALAIANTQISGVMTIAQGGTNSNTAAGALASLTTYATTVTAAGTTTLSNTSAYYQYFTGSSTQTVVLPVTSTIANGWSFHIVNNSTSGNLTVQSSGANTVTTILPNTTSHITCIGTSLTTAADWDYGTTDFNSVTGSGSVVMNTSPIITTPTLTTPVVTNYTETQYAANTGTAITISLANGTLQNLTCNASTTITLPASAAGKSFILIINYAGAYTVAWAGGSTIKWPSGTTPTATSTSGKYDVFSFFQDGVNTYGQTFGLNY